MGNETNVTIRIEGNPARGRHRGKSRRRNHFWHSIFKKPTPVLELVDEDEDKEDDVFPIEITLKRTCKETPEDDSDLDELLNAVFANTDTTTNEDKEEK